MQGLCAFINNECVSVSGKTLKVTTFKRDVRYNTRVYTTILCWRKVLWEMILGRNQEVTHLQAE